MLVFAFVVHKPPKTGFLALRPILKEKRKQLTLYLHILMYYIYWLCVFAGELGKAPSLPTDTLPAQKEPEGATAAPNEEEEEDLMGRLEALRS